MHIVFGMAADGRAYPAHPGSTSGAIGGVVAGPAGMLDVLAGRLGLSGPPIPPVVRIAAWLNKPEAAAAAGPRFYSASLIADALSTARLLLSWRDALVEAGWTPRPGVAGRRIADLAAAELAPRPLPRGRSDLLREVLASLASGAEPDVATGELIEPAELFPPPWRRLVRALSAAGVAVRERVTQDPVAGGDLGRLQRFLTNGEVAPLVGDGSRRSSKAGRRSWRPRPSPTGWRTIPTPTEGRSSCFSAATAASSTRPSPVEACRRSVPRPARRSGSP